MTKKYGVWCVVSGGVTGHREAWLKVDGKIWEGTKEEAEAKAKSCQSWNFRSKANFQYTACCLPYQEESEWAYSN